MVAPLTLEGLKHRFYQEECPYWWAYTATRSSEMIGKFRDDEAYADPDDMLDWSWMQLEELINSMPYGHLKIIIKKSASATKGQSPTLYVKWGLPAGTSSAPTTPGAQPMNMMMGGGWPMFQFMLQQQQQFFNQLMSEKEERYRLNYENQRLSETIEGTDEESWQEYALREGIGLLKTYMQPKINPGQYQPAALGTAGQRTVSKEQPAAPVNQSEQAVSIDFNAIMGDVNAVYQAFGGKYTRNEITRALAIFATQNPEMADQFLGGLIQKLRDHGQ